MGGTLYRIFQDRKQVVCRLLTGLDVEFTNLDIVIMMVKVFIARKLYLPDEDINQSINQ